jgi:integrase
LPLGYGSPGVAPKTHVPKRIKERRTLTDRALRALRPAPAGERYTLYDDLVPPLAARVTDKGAISFIVYRRVAGMRRPLRHKLGRYPELTLEKARQKAREALGEMAAGRRPSEREERQRLEEAQRRANTVAGVAEDFIKRHVAKLRTARKIEAMLRRELIARWGDRPVTSITRRDAVVLLEKIVDRGAPYMARQVLAGGRKLFNWAIARSAYGLEHSPFDRVSARDLIGAPEPRQRVLRDDELRLVWRAAGDAGYPFGPLARLLLLTGQRLNEVAGAQWNEIDLDAALWTIPAKRMKGDAAHEVPLSRPAIELLKGLPRFKRDHLFTTTDGERPVSGFSKAKRRIDRDIARLNGGKPINGWRFHDLRRTMRTHLSALPVQDLVRELVIAHRKPLLHRVYDRHAYLDEKREALTLWAGRLLAIVETAPRGGNVLPMVQASKPRKPDKLTRCDGARRPGTARAAAKPPILRFRDIGALERKLTTGREGGVNCDGSGGGLPALFATIYRPYPSGFVRLVAGERYHLCRTVIVWTPGQE